MEALNIILGIVASVLAIISFFASAKNSKDIQKIKGRINAGDNSTNTIGSNNRVTK